MRFSNSLIPLVGFASSALGMAVVIPRNDLPAPGQPEGPQHVKVKDVTVLGTGCPKGSASVQIDATGSLFEVTFSAYEVQTGPGTKASDWRKNCKLTINMEFDPGYQFSVVETHMIGFAEIPAGVMGHCNNTYSFTGNDGKFTDYKLPLKGPYSGRFDLATDPGFPSYSPCKGSTAILNMNTACNITPTKEAALIAVDHISGQLIVKFHLNWQSCPKV